MNQEFMAIANRIAEQAANGGISVAALTEILSSVFHGEINCYPGYPSDRCHRLAFFVSVHGQLRKGKGHLSFAQAMEALVQHMQGRCSGVTQQAVVITDAWWHDHYEKWRNNIDAMKQNGIRIEFYLIGANGKASVIDA
jgi:hypothetical protein